MKRMLFLILVLSIAVMAATDEIKDLQNDYSKEKVLFVTATSHLDTQWRWTIQDTINEYIPRTLRDNFALFEKYPGYVFSFEGAFRYMLMKEYYPEEYEKLKEYIKKDRWAVCGSWVDAVDTNIPAPESLIRHVLYGNGFFKKEFDKKSSDVFLPDCFGFGFVLPSVAAHCGLKGFSSQKLTWGSSVGIPFDLGLWEGVDGSSIIAALNPDDYVSTIRDDLKENERWVKTINKQGEVSGLFAGYKYFGTGDTGGAPDEESVAWLQKSLEGEGTLKVISSPADLLFKEIWNARGTLPRYRGELLMTTHGTGCYTSEAAMKRWNRRNEQMADAAERASVIADWLGGLIYPVEQIRDTWIRFLWHGFHDDLTGTSLPQAYTFSWNDEIISLNRFSSILSDAVGAVARALDTSTHGIPIVIYNPLAIERIDPVEAHIKAPAKPSKSFRLLNDRGEAIPVQINKCQNGFIDVVFIAEVPPVGFVVYDLLPSEVPDETVSDLKISDNRLENSQYIVSIDKDGNVASIIHKGTGRDILSGPVHLEMFQDNSFVWPAWEVQYKDIVSAPRSLVKGPASIRIIESGPVRAILEIIREDSGSSFCERITLASGRAGDRVDFDTEVNWRSRGTLLKASFPLSVSNLHATYDLGVGAIERPNNIEKKYEVPAQKWADITSDRDDFGVAVMNDSKYGWDKPADNILRLTLLHTPATKSSYRDQSTQDIGRHQFKYAVMGHKGDWRTGLVPYTAARLNQPLVAFLPKPYKGKLGKKFSFVSVSVPGVAVSALKKVENGDGIIIRLQEINGRTVKDASLKFAAPVISAEELNGQEEYIGEARLINGKVLFDINPYSLRTYAVKLKKSPVTIRPPLSKPVGIPFDVDVVSGDGNKMDGDFDGKGNTYPAELFPGKLTNGDIDFRLGTAADGEKNALSCRGQVIKLPGGKFDRVYLLASASDADQKGVFYIGDKPIEITVQDYSGFIGQWNSRVIGGELVNDVERIMPAFIKRDRIAWVGTHKHNKNGRNEPYVFCYLFQYVFDVPPGAKTLRLPDNPNIKIFAVTAALNPNGDALPAGYLYDCADGIGVNIITADKIFIDNAEVSLEPNRKGGEIRYTLDGSEPTPESQLYFSPIKISDTVTIKARVFGAGEENQNTVASMTITKIQPLDAISPVNVENGLEFSYYEGKWRELPDLSALQELKRGKVEKIDLSPRDKDNYFALKFTGFIKVPSDGIYIFYLSSDDGSKLFIGDKEVVNNDGLHEFVEEKGSIALKAGLHPLTVLYFDRGWDKGLSLSISGPPLPKKEVTADMLYRLIK